MVSLLLLLADVSLSQTFRERLVANSYSYAPSAQGQFPTLIAIPGCSGISSDDPAAEETNPQLHEDDLLFRRHYRRMVERLQAEGFVVLLLDIHKGEGLLTACAGEISSERIAEYIDEAISWSRELLYVDSDSVHIIGWSMGGRGVLRWLDSAGNEAAGARSAIVVYPGGCKEHETLTVSVPTLMLLGSSDDIADPRVCEEMEGSATNREQIAVERYPGARHGFDIADAPPMLDIGNGMTIGYQKEAAEASWVAILQFLEAHMKDANQ